MCLLFGPFVFWLEVLFGSLLGLAEIVSPMIPEGVVWLLYFGNFLLVSM